METAKAEEGSRQAAANGRTDEATIDEDSRQAGEQRKAEEAAAAQAEEARQAKNALAQEDYRKQLDVSPHLT